MSAEDPLVKVLAAELPKLHATKIATRQAAALRKHLEPAAEAAIRSYDTRPLLAALGLTDETP